MNVIKTILGLIYDDARLVLTLGVALAISLIFRLAHQPLIAAVLIWAGLIVSLWISIEHELKQKSSQSK